MRVSSNTRNAISGKRRTFHFPIRNLHAKWYKSVDITSSQAHIVYCSNKVHSLRIANVVQCTYVEPPRQKRGYHQSLVLRSYSSQRHRSGMPFDSPSTISDSPLTYDSRAHSLAFFFTKNRPDHFEESRLSLYWIRHPSISSLGMSSVRTSKSVMSSGRTSPCLTKALTGNRRCAQWTYQSSGVMGGGRLRISSDITQCFNIDTNTTHSVSLLISLPPALL